MTTVSKKYQFEAQALVAKAMVVALEAYMHEVSAHSELLLDKDLCDEERKLCETLEADVCESLEVTLQFDNYKIAFKPLNDTDTYDHLVWLLQNIEQSSQQSIDWIDGIVHKAGYNGSNGELLHSTAELKKIVHKD